MSCRHRLRSARPRLNAHSSATLPPKKRIFPRPCKSSASRKWRIDNIDNNIKPNAKVDGSRSNYNVIATKQGQGGTFIHIFYTIGTDLSIEFQKLKEFFEKFKSGTPNPFPPASPKPANSKRTFPRIQLCAGFLHYQKRYITKV